MENCIVCGKSHSRKENVCSKECMDVFCYGSKEKAGKATIDAFAKIGIKVK